MNSQSRTLDPRKLTAQEWLLPLGTGGYAMGCISGAHSRSYHALFVAGLAPPLDRLRLLSHFDVEIEMVDGLRHELACHLYGEGVVHPHGARFLNTFSLKSGRPSWCWSGPGFEFALNLEPRDGGLDLIWSCSASSVRQILLRPYFGLRSHHGGESLEPHCEHLGDESWIRFGAEGGDLCLWHGLEVRTERHVYRNFFLPREKERGLACHEDLTTPFFLLWSPRAQEDAMTLSLRLAHRAKARKPMSPAVRKPPTRVQEWLQAAALGFLITSPESGEPGIIAGYPWFNEWGRDTMIALPGMVAAAEDTALAGRILRRWTESLKGGLLPNRLAEDERACSYNSADAPLWYLMQVERCIRSSGPDEKLMAGALEVVEACRQGTDYGIHVDAESGLLMAGDAGTQLTWMDACHEGECFTPRHGACVELNALFYRGLRFVAEQVEGALGRELEKTADRLRRAFRRNFITEEGLLRDCLSDPVLRLRPNGIMAVAWGLDLVPRRVARAVLDAAARELVTPVGLRSLSPQDPDYRGQYRGGPGERDRAYHQGSVWMWLLGPWLEAELRLSSDRNRTLRWAEERLGLALATLRTGCLGYLGELFEGDAPHRDCGAPAQAWSVCEIYRLIDDWKLSWNRLEELVSLPASFSPDFFFAE